MAGSPAIIVALTTPFDRSARVDHAALGEHVEALVSAGVDSLMPCGTTGEGPLLEAEEVAETISSVVKVAAGRARVFAHVGRPATTGTIELALRAIDDGADAVVAVAPYYYSVPDDHLIAHYRALIEACGDSPTFAYNMPSRTVNDLTTEIVSSLAVYGLAGLKDSTKSLDRHREYLEIAQKTDRPFGVYMGSDGMALEAFRLGAAGSVSAIANFRPDLLMSLTDELSRGSGHAAQEIQREISELRSRSSPTSLAFVKQKTAEWMRSRGVSYSPSLRAPIA